MGVEAAIDHVPSIQPGVYRHYRGGLYWVSGLVTIDEESGRYRVVYYSLKKGVHWGRFHDIFTEWIAEPEPAATADELVEFGDRLGVRRFERVGGLLLWWWYRLLFCLGLLKIPG